VEKAHLAEARHACAWPCHAPAAAASAADGPGAKGNGPLPAPARLCPVGAEQPPPPPGPPPPRGDERGQPAAAAGTAAAKEQGHQLPMPAHLRPVGVLRVPPGSRGTSSRRHRRHSRRRSGHRQGGQFPGVARATANGWAAARRRRICARWATPLGTPGGQPDAGASAPGGPTPLSDASRAASARCRRICARWAKGSLFRGVKARATRLAAQVGNQPRLKVQGTRRPQDAAGMGAGAAAAAAAAAAAVFRSRRVCARWKLAAAATAEAASL
jgi:hypothetical protein